MPAKCRVVLSDEERTALVERTTSGVAPARAVTRARTLLKADESTDGAAWTDGVRQATEPYCMVGGG